MIHKLTVFFFYVFFSLLFQDLYSQDSSKEFNDLRRSILSEIAARDIDDALSYTDTLEGLASTKRQEIKVKMTRAVLYNQRGDIEEALSIAMDVESDFERNKNYSDQIGAVGFIASNFREVGLNREALYYLNKTATILDKIKDEHMKGQYGALMNHEKVGIYTLKKDYHKVEKAIAEAYRYIEFIEEGGQKSFFMATTMYLEGKNKLRRENFYHAETLFNRAKDILGTKEDLLYGQIQLSLAEIYLKRLDYNLTKNVIEEIKPMVENSQYFQLKRNFYKLSSSYYYNTGNIGKYKKYNTLYIDNREATDSNFRDIADQSVAQLRFKVASKQKRIGYVFVLLGVLGAGIIAFIIINYRKNKKKNQRFREIIEKLRAGQSIEPPASSINDQKPILESVKLDDQPINNEGMAKETEQRIIKELNGLESTPEIYLQSDVSITKIAAILDTNTKYLAGAIRTHQNKNFNTYVNDFRINYILTKLQENPQYLEYKISYLADESGFSSHSKFSSEFKRVVGMSPSVFIKQLRAA